MKFHSDEQEEIKLLYLCVNIYICIYIKALFFSCALVTLASTKPSFSLVTREGNYSSSCWSHGDTVGLSDEVI